MALQRDVLATSSNDWDDCSTAAAILARVGEGTWKPCFLLSAVFRLLDALNPYIYRRGCQSNGRIPYRAKGAQHDLVRAASICQTCPFSPPDAPDHHRNKAAASHTKPDGRLQKRR